LATTASCTYVYAYIWILFYENKTRSQKPGRVKYGTRSCHPLFIKPLLTRKSLCLVGARIEHSSYTATDSHGSLLTTVGYMKFMTRTGSRRTTRQRTPWYCRVAHAHIKRATNIIFVRFTTANRIVFASLQHKITTIPIK